MSMEAELDARLEHLKDMVVNGNRHERRVASMTLSRDYFFDRSGIRELIEGVPEKRPRRPDIKQKHRS